MNNAAIISGITFLGGIFYGMYQCLSDLKKARMCSAICQESGRDDHMTILECGHSFHASCIRAWIKEHKNCPVCGKDM